MQIAGFIVHVLSSMSPSASSAEPSSLLNSKSAVYISVDVEASGLSQANIAY